MGFDGKCTADARPSNRRTVSDGQPRGVRRSAASTVARAPQVKAASPATTTQAADRTCARELLGICARRRRVPKPVQLAAVEGRTRPRGLGAKTEVALELKP